MPDPARKPASQSIETPTVVLRPGSTIRAVPRTTSSDAARPAFDLVRIFPWLLIVAVAISYASAINTSFIFDDEHYISENTSFDPPQTQVLKGRRFVPHVTFFLNYWAEKAISGHGFNPRGYKLTNVLIHMGAAVTLLALARRAVASPAVSPTLGRGGPWVAFAIALLWAVHPLTTQAVTYVIQRMESLMSLLLLLTIYCLARSADAVKPRRAALWAALACVACAIGSMTKEVMVVAPLLALLYDRTFIACSFFGALARRWWLYLLLVVAVSLPWWALPSGSAAGITGGEGVSAGFGLDLLTPRAYFLSQPGVILGYLSQVIWPRTLCFDWLWPVARTSLEIIPPLIAISLFGIATLVALWRYPVVGFLGAWFFILLGPTSSIVPIADLRVEHRMYLPLAGCVGLIVTAVFVVGAWLKRRQPNLRHALPSWSVAALALCAIALGARTAVRNLDYATPVTLWQSVLDARKDNYRAHYNLGTAYFRQARLSNGRMDDTLLEKAAAEITLANAYAPLAEQYASLGVIYSFMNRPDLAERALREALKLDSTHVKANYRLGILLQNKENPDLDEAAECFERAIKFGRGYDEPYSSLALTRVAQKRYDEAERIFLKAIDQFPLSAKVRGNYGQLLLSQGRVDDAVKYLQAATQAPFGGELFYTFLGNALLRKGDTESAMEAFGRALAVNPDDPDALQSVADVYIANGNPDTAADYLRLAARNRQSDLGLVRKVVWLYATAPAMATRDTSLMMRLADMLNRVTQEKSPEALDALAAAQARVERYDEAAQTADKAASLADADNKTELAANIRARAARYREGKPYDEGVSRPPATMPALPRRRR